MQTGPLYDRRLVNSYDGDLFGIFQLARETSLAQLKGGLSVSRVLDIGCGTGLLLETLRRELPPHVSIGLDPSQAMLDLAAQRGTANTIQATVLEAENHLAAASLDLICMHFVLSYVDPSAALGVIARLLKPGGKLSLVTSTFESLGTIAKLGAQFISSEELHRKMTVPANEESLRQVLQENGFRVQQFVPLRRELLFEDVEQLYAFGVNQGWLVQLTEQLDLVRANPSLLDGLIPFRDEFRGVALLAERI